MERGSQNSCVLKGSGHSRQPGMIPYRSCPSKPLATGHNLQGEFLVDLKIGKVPGPMPGLRNTCCLWSEPVVAQGHRLNREKRQKGFLCHQLFCFSKCIFESQRTFSIRYWFLLPASFFLIQTSNLATQFPHRKT